jgi:hypothetical protein
MACETPSTAREGVATACEAQSVARDAMAMGASSFFAGSRRVIG